MSDPRDPLDTLRSRFTLSGLTIEEGFGDLPRLTITTPHATAQLYLHGAHLTSYRPTGEQDLIFLSSKSFYRHDKAIRGGVPICLPWFAAKPDDASAPRTGWPASNPGRCNPPPSPTTAASR